MHMLSRLTDSWKTLEFKKTIISGVSLSSASVSRSDQQIQLVANLAFLKILWNMYFFLLSKNHI